MTTDRPLFFRKDPLYGEIEFDQKEQRIIGTPQIQRLSDISLSAVPPITLDRQIPSRLEHSKGVSYLAKTVGQKPEFKNYSRELFVAGIAHDVGSPPFSHLGERFLHKVLGVSHEQFAKRIIADSELSRELESQGIETDTVLRMINGQLKPISEVIAGTMDVDNLDNIQRYGQAMGIFENPLYSGEKLAKAFTLHKGSIALEEGLEKELKGWLESRHRVYQYVYGPQNQVMGAMVSRALQFAYEGDELPEEFFFWTDTKAYKHLLQDCNPKTRNIAGFAATRQPYSTVTDLVTTEPPNSLINLCMNSDNRDIVADSLAEAFSIPREDICVYFGKSRNYRSVNIPIINGLDISDNNKNKIQQEWTAQAFVHPEHYAKFDKINEMFRLSVGIDFI